MSNATNNIEIRVIGQMRSGNHAIIAWLQNLYPNKSICFLNNIRHGDYDPFENYAQIELTGIDELTDTDTLKNSNKDVLIYSYEDSKSLEIENVDFISSISNESFERNREQYFGKSNHRFDVIIIRDPFNCLSSRLVLLRKRGPMGGLDNLTLIKENWKILAKKALQIREKSNADEIVINYNKWISDNTYQAEIAKKLMGIYAVSSLDNISKYGPGSSFSNTNVPRLTMDDLIEKWHKIFSLKRWG